MNNIITDREDLFWAKMAGRDVDISTMTPPVASSMREKLMLEVAEKIAQGGGGGSLPEAGADGNVLTADDGEWVSAAPPQSDNDYIVTADLDSATLSINNFSPSSYSAIRDAIAANKNVRLVALDTDEGVQWNADFDLDVGGEITFSGTVSLESGDYLIVAEVESNNNVATLKAMNVYPLQELPNISSSNKGKVLGVSNGGEWTLLDPTDLSVAPLVITGESSGTNVTITNATAAEISAAWNANREVLVPVPGANIRFRITECAYNDDNNYRFKFEASTISASSGSLTLYLLDFENSLTGSSSSHEYVPTT